MEENQKSPLGNDISPQKNESPRSEGRILLVTFLIIFAACLVGGIYLYLKSAIYPPETTKADEISNQVNNTPKKESSNSAMANTSFTGKLAFIRNYNLWVVNNGQEKQITSDAKFTPDGSWLNPTFYYSNPSISPDGKKIVFYKTTLQSNKETTSLLIVNTDGTGLATLIAKEDFYRTYPVQWFKDNQNILFEKMTLGSEKNEIIKFDTKTNTSQTLTTYINQGGCGGGDDDPSVSLAAQEGAQLNHISYPVNFLLSADNNYLVHNNSCIGVGVNIYNLTAKQDKLLDKNITRVIYSPDDSKIAGVSGKQILTFDKKNGNLLSRLNTSFAPQAIYWSSDGKTIYYSTNTQVKQITQKDTLGNDLSFVQNQSSLWSISANGSNNKRIKDFDLFALRPLSVSTDNKSALLVGVENATRYADALKQGNVSNVSEVYPKVNLINLELNSGTVSTVSANTNESNYFAR